MISIMQLYDNNIQISVHIRVNQKLVVSFTSMVCFFDDSIKTFNLLEDSLIKEIVYEFLLF